MNGGPLSGAGGPLEIVGPYERWVYGDGHKYVPAPIRDMDHGLLSGFLEIPGGATVDELHAARSLRRVWFPTLWEPKGHGCKYEFIPFVLRLPEGTSVMSLDENRLVAELKGSERTWSGADLSRSSHDRRSSCATGSMFRSRERPSTRIGASRTAEPTIRSRPRTPTTGTDGHRSSSSP